MLQIPRLKINLTIHNLLLHFKELEENQQSEFEDCRSQEIIDAKEKINKI